MTTPTREQVDAAIERIRLSMELGEGFDIEGLRVDAGILLADHARLRKRDADVRKLVEAAEQAIPWIGERRTGPLWATDDAAIRNAEMCDHAFRCVVEALKPFSGEQATEPVASRDHRKGEPEPVPGEGTGMNTPVNTSEQLRDKIDSLATSTLMQQVLHGIVDLIPIPDEIEAAAERLVASGSATLGREPLGVEADSLLHTRSCAAMYGNGTAECTCGLKWRVQLQTEQAMHAAWRKRAEEAEAREIRRIRPLNRLATWAQQDATQPIPVPVQEWVLNQIKEALGQPTEFVGWEPDSVSAVPITSTSSTEEIIDKTATQETQL